MKTGQNEYLYTFKNIVKTIIVTHKELYSEPFPLIQDNYMILVSNGDNSDFVEYHKRKLNLTQLRIILSVAKFSYLYIGHNATAKYNNPKDKVVYVLVILSRGQ